MFNLIKKDLIVSRNTLLINIVVLLAMQVFMFKIALLDLFLFIGIIYTVLLIITPITAEEKFKTESLISSMPVTRRKIIGSRFIYAALIIPVVVSFVFLYGFMLDNLTTSRYIDFQGSFSFGQFISVLFIATLITSVFIPFTYKFGQMGLVYGLGAGVLLSTVFFLIAGLGLRINLLDRTIGRFFESLESGLISNLFKNFSAIFSGSFAGLITTLLILSIMILLMFISFKISVFIYCRKDL